MDFAQIMQDAAAESEGIIAQMQGMEQGAAGNFQFNGATFTGVFGQATIEEIPQPQGGYRRRAVLPLTVTKTQTDFLPVAKAKLIRLSPAITYTIDKFDANDPLVWVVLLVKVGEAGSP